MFVETAQMILNETEWLARQRAHEERLRPWLEPHLARASRQEKHPVHDFLFDYYSYLPRQLRRWQPGLGVVLAGESARQFLKWPGHIETPDGVTVDPSAFKPERRDFVRWLAGMLQACRDRPGFFGCYGLHEWAMVYRADAVRHEKWPLRFDHESLAKIVESIPVRCSHFDAFRFFTNAARPLNRLQPTRATSAEFEQPACLHANMDLYKWSYKLAPFSPSELVADAFELARDIREVDMRASPYDFASLGFTPIKIETTEGRMEYERHQREFALRAGPIRERVILLCERLIGSWN
jgi:hypothetical protein